MSSRVSSSLLVIGPFLFVLGCGSDPRDALIAQLRNPDAEQRRAAALALGRQTPVEKRVVEALKKSVGDGDIEVRRLSINALGKIGAAAESSLPALIAALRDPEPSVRLRAALAIQKIDPENPEFVSVIVDAMRAGDGRVLLEVGAMGKDATWAIPCLIELLSHRTAQLRALTAQTLGRIGPTASEAKLALQQALRDPNPAVRLAAQEALDRIQVQPAVTAK